MAWWPVIFKNCNGLLVSSSRWGLVSIIRLSLLFPRKFEIHEGHHDGKDAEGGYRGSYVTSERATIWASRHDWESVWRCWLQTSDEDDEDLLQGGRRRKPTVEAKHFSSRKSASKRIFNAGPDTLNANNQEAQTFKTVVTCSACSWRPKKMETDFHTESILVHSDCNGAAIFACNMTD